MGPELMNILIIHELLHAYYYGSIKNCEFLKQYNVFLDFAWSYNVHVFQSHRNVWDWNS